MSACAVCTVCISVCMCQYMVMHMICTYTFSSFPGAIFRKVTQISHVISSKCIFIIVIVKVVKYHVTFSCHFSVV